ncbi:Acg family FMN-binding oxidoreductase [Catellatospora tritici]|uniref:Acg family FMN-binding oxidoreductase n=1 Tax=Catellatospora tritici TaxID=2851566 RepID=UPI001C2CE723|nr:nitroreductase family protein [Catellatospora tritici]MBV1850475.1 nitroreductase family protein [Catellatospora tritici]
MTTALTLTDTAFRDVVAAAVRAPSLHNSQPWRFRNRNGTIEVYADPTRSLLVADPTGWALRIACGAATLNARLALAAMGLAAHVRLLPDPDDPLLLARLTPTAAWQTTPAEEALFAAIERRFSNREPFHPAPVPVHAIVRIENAALAEGAWVELHSGQASLEVISEIVRAADSALRSDGSYQAELRAWTRSDRDDRDGVPAPAGGPVPQADDLLPRRAYGSREPSPGGDFDPEPLVVVLGTAADSPAQQLQAGIALQRVLLTITDAGLAASMLSQPIENQAERDRLRLALGRSDVPQMVLRVGVGRPGFPTPRRDLAEVIDES